MVTDTNLREFRGLNENYYALLISIITGVNASEALRCMGLTERECEIPENKIK